MNVIHKIKNVLKKKCFHFLTKMESALLVLIINVKEIQKQVQHWRRRDLQMWNIESTGPAEQLSECRATPASSTDGKMGEGSDSRKG